VTITGQRYSNDFRQNIRRTIHSIVTYNSLLGAKRGFYQNAQVTTIILGFIAISILLSFIIYILVLLLLLKIII